MNLYRHGTKPTDHPPESSFVGNVQIGNYFHRSPPSRLAGAVVTFAAGARTPWKMNPAGQTLVVTSGTGWAQIAGEPIVEIRAGDMIWCPPGTQHWEGGTPDQEMTYVAVQEESGTDGVQFLARVTDEEYAAGASFT